MNRNRILFLLFLFSTGSIFWLNSCSTPSYSRLEKEELAKGIKYDSLFLGLKFGMTKKDFYTSCWKLNHDKIITQGPGNLSVEYKLDSTELKYPAYMRFYPDFNSDTLTHMPVEFTYMAWAPWNQHLSADSLLIDVKQLLERWYGGSFIEYKNESVRVWARIDGNRRIRLYKKGLSTVKVEFTDVSVKYDDSL